MVRVSSVCSSHAMWHATVVLEPFPLLGAIARKHKGSRPASRAPGTDRPRALFGSLFLRKLTQTPGSHHGFARACDTFCLPTFARDAHNSNFSSLRKIQASVHLGFRPQALLLSLPERLPQPCLPFALTQMNPFSMTTHLVSNSLLQLGLQFPNDVYSVLFSRKIIFDGKDKSKLNEVLLCDVIGLLWATVFHSLFVSEIVC